MFVCLYVWGQSKNYLELTESILSTGTDFYSDPNYSYPARRFKSATNLKLTDSTINEITNKHIASFEAELKQIYGATEFNKHPENVKLALFDMIFNLGMPKLKNNYPRFNWFIKACDYKSAATESNRNGIAAERNQYVKDLLSK